MTHNRGHKTRRRQRAGFSLFTSKPTFTALSDPSKTAAALKTANTLQSAVVKFKDLPYAPGLINETTMRGCKGIDVFLPITTLPKPKNIDTSSVQELLSVNGTEKQVGQAETSKFLEDVLSYVANCKDFDDEQLKNAYAAIDDESDAALTAEESCSVGLVVPKLRCVDADAIATRMAKMIGFLQYGVVKGGRSRRRRGGVEQKYVSQTAGQVIPKPIGPKMSEAMRAALEAKTLPGLMEKLKAFDGTNFVKVKATLLTPESELLRKKIGRDLIDSAETQAALTTFIKSQSPGTGASRRRQRSKRHTRRR